MLNHEIIKAWKNVEYRERLSSVDHKAIPEHPAGTICLVDAELQQVAAGNTGDYLTIGCCGLTFFVITWGCCVSADSICKGT